MNIKHVMNFGRALDSTVEKLKSEIIESRRKGKIPADYSLGFANAMIFVQHQFDGRKGKPKFYTRTTSIGNLPKPMVLASDDAIKNTSSYQILVDQLILRLRDYVKLLDPEVPAVVKLNDALAKLDQFIEGEKVHEQVRLSAVPSGEMPTHDESDGSEKR